MTDLNDLGEQLGDLTRSGVSGPGDTAIYLERGDGLAVSTVADYNRAAHDLALAIVTNNFAWYAVWFASTEPTFRDSIIDSAVGITSRYLLHKATPEDLPDVMVSLARFITMCRREGATLYGQV